MPWGRRLYGCDGSVFGEKWRPWTRFPGRSNQSSASGGQNVKFRGTSRKGTSLPTRGQVYRATAPLIVRLLVACREQHSVRRRERAVCRQPHADIQHDSVRAIPDTYALAVQDPGFAGVLELPVDACAVVPPRALPLWVSKLALGGSGVISGSSLHVASVSDSRWNRGVSPALSCQLTSKRLGVTVWSQWSFSVFIFSTPLCVCRVKPCVPSQADEVLRCCPLRPPA